MMEGKGIGNVCLTIMLVATLIAESSCQCGSNSPLSLTVTRNETQTFSSPNYPLLYPNNADCAWLISTDDNSTITLLILEIELEDSSSCAFDFVSLYDGDSQDSPVIAVLCGRRYPGHSYHSTGPHMYVRFVSDTFISLQGFRAEYTAVHPHAQKERGPCGPDSTLMLTATRNMSATIKFPQHPDEYPNYAFCSWNITTDPNSVIRVDVISVDIEEDEACSYDFIAILDLVEFTYTTPLLICSDRYNGTQIYSAGPYMLVYFITDVSVTGQGFELLYTATHPSEGENNTLPHPGPCMPGSVLTLTATRNVSGTIYSPNYPSNYPNYAVCSWNITTDPDSVIRVDVVSANIEAGENCPYDYIAMVDGVNFTHMDPFLICGDQSDGAQIYSAGPYMLIYFITDSSITRSGFELQYTAAHPYERTTPNADTCGSAEELLASATRMQFLESPNYPNNYPRGYSCTWRIRADPGHVVEMTVADMELEPHTQCAYDSVIIYDSNYIDVLDTYCHPNAKGNIETSSHRDMYVRFTSDASIVYRGFRLAYRAINVQTTTTIPITTTRTTTTTPRTTITTTTTTPTTTTAAVASPTPLPYKSSQQDKTVAVLAGVLGAVILLCLIVIVVLIYCFLRRSKQSSSQSGRSGTFAIRPPSVLYHSNQQDGLTLVNADYMVPTANAQAEAPPEYSNVATSVPPVGASGGTALPPAEALPTKKPIPDA